MSNAILPPDEEEKLYLSFNAKEISDASSNQNVTDDKNKHTYKTEYSDKMDEDDIEGSNSNFPLNLSRKNNLVIDNIKKEPEEEMMDYEDSVTTSGSSHYGEPSNTSNENKNPVKSRIKIEKPAKSRLKVEKPDTYVQNDIGAFPSNELNSAKAQAHGNPSSLLLSLTAHAINNLQYLANHQHFLAGMNEEAQAAANHKHFLADMGEEGEETTNHKHFLADMGEEREITPPIPLKNNIEASLIVPVLLSELAVPETDEPLTSREEKTYKCALCPYSTNEKRNHESHVLAHTGEKPFQCEICDFRTSYKISLKAHYLTHTGEKPFSCDLCDYKCNRKRSLKRHNLTHTGEKPFACELCHFRTSQKSNLKSHMRTHLVDKTFKCRQCPYRARQKYHLQTHNITHHFDSDHFNCEMCPFETDDRNEFKNHIPTHSKEKIYTCGVCHYTTCVKWNLQQHELTHASLYKDNSDDALVGYPIERSYRCDTCPYSTTRKGNLKRHMTRHNRGGGTNKPMV